MIKEKVSAQNFMRFGPLESWQCKNKATLEVVVKGQGKMLMCDDCLPKFRKYATLPWTVRNLCEKKKAKK